MTAQTVVSPATNNGLEVVGADITDTVATIGCSLCDQATVGWTVTGRITACRTIARGGCSGLRAEPMVRPSSSRPTGRTRCECRLN